MSRDSRFRITTGWIFFLASISLWFILLFLWYRFDIPRVDYSSTDFVFTKLSKHLNTILQLWFWWVVPTVMLIAAVIRLDRSMKHELISYRKVIVCFGVLTWVVQLLGMMRWVFVAPELSQAYFDMSTAKATKISIELIWQSINQLAGHGMYYGLGALFAGLWLLLLSVPIIRSPLFRSWLGWAAGLLGVSFIIASYYLFDRTYSWQEAQFDFYFKCYSILFTVFVIWQIALGWYMMTNEGYEERFKQSY